MSEQLQGMSKPHFVPSEAIEHAILLIRNQKVMLDGVLAALYGVATGHLNRAVKRNLDRFPSDFMFQRRPPEREFEMPIWHLKFSASSAVSVISPTPSPNRAWQWLRHLKKAILNPKLGSTLKKIPSLTAPNENPLFIEDLRSSSPVKDDRSYPSIVDWNLG
jgi:hypothetical protein